jgi:hypothetical protein
MLENEFLQNKADALLQIAICSSQFPVHLESHFLLDYAQICLRYGFGKVYPIN